MKKSVLKSLCVSLLLAWTMAACAGDYEQHPQVLAFIDEMVEKHSFERQQLQAWFAEVEKKQSILDAISRPAEKTHTWGSYRKLFVTSSRIRQGVAFWRDNEQTLQAAEEKWGVPASVIVAIIGVETRYGRHAGRYRVLDALTTLAFDYPRRSAFFKKELEHFLLLVREQKQAPLDLLGSYAGAMGYGQFIPSSYRHYAVDFDADGIIDIWKNPVDAIGSVANYFSEHGWQTGEPVVVRTRVAPHYFTELLNDQLKPTHTVASLADKGYTPVVPLLEQAANMMRLEGDKGAEFWMGLQNFYVITRYNHSRRYAMAVWQLSQALEAARAN